MIDKIIIKNITQILLSKPYIKLSELMLEVKLTEKDIEEYVEIVRDNLSDLGMIIEIIELNKTDYILIYLEESKKKLSNLQLGLLSVITKLCIDRNGYLPDKIKINLDNKYNDDMKVLEECYFIEKNSDSYWSLSPLGFLTVYPIIDRTNSIIQNLTNKI